jgi:aminoglycoside phosphotransferase (APT) family kinase protein
MHDDEVETNSRLVRRLLEAQFPRWADLRVEAVRSAGTDNALFRLGDEMVVRLPRMARAAEQAAKEQDWLPRLAPLLPLAIPVPLERGSPCDFYPWQWSVYRWLEGTAADSSDSLSDPVGAAAELGRFIAALHGIESTGVPQPGPHNAFRGVPLSRRDGATRTAIHALRDTLDMVVATASWNAALGSPAWSGKPIVIHGDLQPANLLLRNGRLSAVIDFGCLGAGDPACDLMAAWTFLPATARYAFRAATAADDAAWARGRGWALSFGLIALPYYESSNPVLASIARRTIDEVLIDFTNESGCA